jgi:hypothetical protein
VKKVYLCSRVVVLRAAVEADSEEKMLKLSGKCKSSSC